MNSVCTAVAYPGTFNNDLLLIRFAGALQIQGLGIVEMVQSFRQPQERISSYK